MNYRQALVIGVALGVVAAAVVWYLERFESRRLFNEMREYMAKHDDFRQWMREREGGSDAA